MSKVFSYVRFSSAKQSAGDSYARQTKAAKAFADEHGFELADPKEYLFFDAGRSAYKGKHLDDNSELGRFLDYVKDGSIPAGSFLVIESLDRLSREKVKEALPRFLDLLAKGINVYTSVDRHLYTQDYDVTDLIISIISMARAHEESAVKGVRVSAAWRNKQKEARATGKPLGKLRPLWLDIRPDGYVLNPDRAAIVRRIFNMSAQGYGSRSIAVAFNHEGIPAFTAGRKNFSGLWNYSGVRHIMESRTVLGEYQPHVFIDGVRTPAGEPILGHFPPVVTEDEFYLANAAKDARHSGGVTKTTTNFNMLTGILCCYRCGGMMHLQGQRQRKYFKCANSNRGTCDSGIIGAPRAEAVFKEILSKLDSLSLVQNNVGSITKRLQINEGKTAELKSKQAEQEASHSEFPSRSTAKLLAELERDLDLLGSDHQTLSQQLAADKVISKDDFFQKLDLVTYEGRVAANNLVKRLGVYVYAHKGGRTDEVYCVSDTKAIPTPLTPDIHHLMFVVAHKNGDMRIYAHQDKYREIEKIQRGSAGEPRHAAISGAALTRWFRE
jgi:DNA invertase Pin-like site-specific DNA recombinase